MSVIIDISKYEKRYGLGRSTVGLMKIEEPGLDINAPGLLMHGSEKDPYTILKYGLAPQQTTKNEMETEWQICLGLNSKSRSLTINGDMARKNSAVKYSGNFSPDGIVYVLSERVRDIPGYREFWDTGADPKGYAWVKQAIVSDMIIALITKNMNLATAAVYATDRDRPIYRLSGECYKIAPIT